MRIAAILEYDGSRFPGWQRQEKARSVQAVVEDALSKVANEPLKVTVAGRTDAGVHAAGQVMHFDTSAMRSDFSKPSRCGSIGIKVKNRAPPREEGCPATAP